MITTLQIFAASRGASNTTSNIAAVPLLILFIPMVYALFSIVIAYFSGVKYRRAHILSKQHEWLLQQKNSSLAILESQITGPLTSMIQTIDALYAADKITIAVRKNLMDAIAVSKSRIENLSKELQRSTLSITHESVDIVPFYRSATTLMIIGLTGFIVVIIDAVLVSTENLKLSTTEVATQVGAYIFVMVVVVLTSRYRRISQRLLIHSKATSRLQQDVDDSKDHIVSLVVKIVSADIEKLTADIALSVANEDKADLDVQIAELNRVMGRLSLLSNIESRLIKSDVKLLNIEDIIEEVFREFQLQLNERGIQVEHFNRVSASKIQLGIVQDRSLLKTAFVEIFKNAIENAPEQSVVKIVSEHSFTSSSITVTDQGSGEPFVHTAVKLPEESKAAGAQHLGVGLYIADQIAHILGGEVRIIHSVGMGSSVQITFINSFVR